MYKFLTAVILICNVSAALADLEHELIPLKMKQKVRLELWYEGLDSDNKAQAQAETIQLDKEEAKLLKEAFYSL